MDEWEFPVSERPLLVQWNDVYRERLKSHKVVVRVDTNEVLGVVGEKYPIIEHGEVVKMMDLLLMDKNHERSVRLTKNGARMFAKYSFTDMRLEIRKGDIVNPTLTVTNSYDGSMRLHVELGAFRLLCSNGLTVGQKLLYRVRKHVGKTASVLDDLESIMQKVLEAIEIVFPIWEKWAKTPISVEDGVGLLAELPIPDKYAECIRMRWEKNTEDRTLWDVYNAITYVTSHDIDTEKVSVERIRDIEAKSVTYFEKMAEDFITTTTKDAITVV